MIDAGAFAGLREASRELHLACDPAGRVLFADARANRLIGVRAGALLRAFVTPGCEDKLAAFVEQACAGAVAGWELPFLVQGDHVEVSLSAVPHAAGFLAIGHVVPAGYAVALRQVSDMISEVVDLNRAALAQRNEIAARHAELLRLNAELADSHQGVLTLHLELQAEAQHTRGEHGIQARVIANLSHELRAPLHAILGLTQLVVSDPQSALTPEQERQIELVRVSARELLALVDDTLDLGRLDAGRTEVRIERFELDEFVGAMRGALRPLLPTNGSVVLIFDDVPKLITLGTDRVKLSQIVRNLVSNAIKFTERGQVRVCASVRGELLTIGVTDSGIGIAPSDLATIFEEYGQVGSHLQERSKGTGLGLPLSLRLAERLGGTVGVESEPASGSTFSVVVPTYLLEASAAPTRTTL